MRVLEDEEWDEELEKELKQLTEFQVEERLEEVVSFLSHSSPGVRFEAVQLLARAGLRPDALSRRLDKEDDEVVLAEICESLGDAQHSPSIEKIKKLAKDDLSEIVRSYAAMAAFDIADSESCSFLAECARSETSSNVKATLGVLLLMCQNDYGVEIVAESLLCDDTRVRAAVVNVIDFYEPRFRQEKVLELLVAARDRESLDWVRRELERTIGAFVD